ncbi:MAG TPA: glycosyltransferase family 39 protein [Chloroflexota bacterium]|nr:glycosyltransferase family 39 protein [Chloroflexota bacterium]
MLAIPHRLRKPAARLSVPLLTVRAGTAWWQHAVALGPLLLAAALAGYRLDQEGYGNLYYAATVRSMLASWHNFFFAAFDPGGFVSVDKPPLGFWAQALSAKLLGFSGLALLLPEALAGVAAVGLLYYLVQRAFGPLAGFLAALLLTLTPISVATSRNNTIDSLLVLVVLLAAGATLRAVETGWPRWLFGAAAVAGVGFNVKMLEAYLVLPALYLVYLVAGPRRWPARLLHLAAATAVLLAVSLSWAVAVDLTPPAARPYVGSSEHNSVLELIVWHNGLSRVLPGVPLFGGPMALGANVPPAPRVAPLAAPGAASDAPGAAFGDRGFGAFGIGAPGPLRLFTQPLGSQIGWLLPLALFSLAAIASDLRRAPGRPLARASALLWGVWLLSVGAFFSLTRQFQPYYLVMLAPASAALGGVGLALSWQAYRAGRRAGWLLPLILSSSAVGELALLASFPDWSARLTPWIAGLALASLAALALGRWRPWARRQPGWLPALAGTAGLLALLAAPAVWASAPAWAGMGPRPLADPTAGARRGRAFAPTADAAAYLVAHRDDAAFLAATLNANAAAPLILATGAPVMAVGGFSGADPILTADEFAARVAAGEVRYALFPARGERAGRGPLGDRDRQQPLVAWVQDHCTALPATAWQPRPAEGQRAAQPTRENVAPPANAAARPLGYFGPGAPPTLYDCAVASASPSSGG